MAAFAILDFIPVIGKIIDRIIPDPVAAAAAKQAAFDAALKGELAWLDADVKLAVGQMEINKIEAATPGIFKGGWRPFAAWACVAAGVVYTIVRALLPGLVHLAAEGFDVDFFHGVPGQ